MKNQCIHFNQNFVDKIVGYPNIKNYWQNKINDCVVCSVDETKSVNENSFVSQYNELELNAIKVKTMLMQSLSDDFKKCVFMEMNIVGSLKTAFNSINVLYYQFFGQLRYSSYENFLKTL